jgi:hypothetical protein
MSPGLKEIKGHFGDLKEQGTDLARTFTGVLVPGALGVALGAQKMAEALAEGAKAAAAEEAAQNRLGQSLKNNVAGWNGNTEAVNRTIDARKKLAYDDDLLRESFTQLVTRTKDVNEAFRLQSVAMDLARGRGLSLETASNLVGRAFSGNTAMLQRYGIAVEKHATGMQALTAIEAAYHGQAQAYANTSAGAFDKLQIAWDDASKAAGKALLPALTAIAEELAKDIPRVVDLATQVGQVLKPAFDVLGMVLAPIAGLLGGIGAVLDALSGKARDTGDAIDGDFASGVQSGTDKARVSVSNNMSEIDRIFAETQDNAGTYGTDTGEGWSENTSTGISDKQGDVESSVGDVADAVDQGERFGAIGQSVGASYVGGPTGVTGGMASREGNVSAGVGRILTIMNVQQNAASLGYSIGQTYAANIQAGMGGAAGTLGVNIGGGAPSARPSGAFLPPMPAYPFSNGQTDPSQMDPYSMTPPRQDSRPPWQPRRIDPDPLTHDANRRAEERGLDEDAKDSVVEGNRKANPLSYGAGAVERAATAAAAAAKKAEGDAKKSASDAKKDAAAAAAEAKRQDSAADSSRQVTNELNLERAKQGVAAAQTNLNNITSSFNVLLDDQATKLKASQDAEKGALAEQTTRINQAQAALAKTQQDEKRELAGLDSGVKSLESELKNLKATEAEALKPLQQEAEKAGAALDLLRQKAALVDQAFDRQAHDLSNQMYELEQAEKGVAAPFDETLKAQAEGMQALQAEVEAINQKYAVLTQLNQELNSLNREQASSDHAEQLHKEGLAIDNLNARLATATGAEREQILAQLQAAQAQKDRDSKKFGLEERIAQLEASKQKEMDAVNLRIHAAELEQQATQRAKAAALEEYETKKAQIAEEQALLDHKRQEYDYEQNQKAIALQQTIDNANAEIASIQKLYLQKEIEKQGEIDMMTELRTQRAAFWQDAVEKRQADVTDAQDRLGKIRQTYSDEQTEINNTTQALKDSQAQAEATGKTAVDTATKVEAALRQAYGIVEKIDQANDKGAKLPTDQAKALADAQATIDKIVPQLPPLALGYTNAATAMDTAKTAAQGVKRDAFDPMRDSLDPEKQDSLAAAWLAAWDENKDNSFKKLYDTSLHDMGHATEIWRDGTVLALKAVIAQYDTLISKMSQAGYGPPSTEPPGRAGGGGVNAGQMYLVGENGPEYFVPNATGYVYPNGTAPAMSGGGGFGGGDIHIHLGVISQQLPRGQQEWDNVGRQISRSVKRHMTYTGRDK